MVKRIQLNQLSKYTNWPNYLLELVQFEKKCKNKNEILREYDIEKWGSLYKKIENISSKKLSLNLVNNLFLGQEKTIFSIKDNLYQANIIYAHKLYLDVIYKNMREFFNNIDTIIELGAGYGSVIFHIAKKLKSRKFNFIAGELTEQGQNCLKLISEKLFSNKIKVLSCDFTSNEIVKEDLPKNSLIYTSLSITCVPNLPNNFFENICKLKPKYIVFFEPIPQFFGNSLIGLLRRKYVKLNDYNQTLYEIIEENLQSSSLKIIRKEENIFGENCFLPASLIALECVKND